MTLEPAGAASGQGRAGPGQYGVAPDADLMDGSGDPVEQAAARRLRQAVQRIENARASRRRRTGSGKDDTPVRKRDW